MRIQAYYRTFKDEDIYEGDIGVPMESVILECSPNSDSVADAVADILPYFAPEGPLEWSSYPHHTEGDWLTLSGRWEDYSIGADQYFELSLHGPVAVLERFKSHWDR